MGDPVTQDVRRREDTEAILRYYLGFEELVTSISTQLINIPSPGIEEAIDRALQRIGEFSGVDRSYLFRVDRASGTMTNTNEWCAPGIVPQMTTMQELPVDSLPWLMDRLSRLESVHIPAVPDLTAEAARERAMFEAQDIQSLILVPMALRRELIGFLGFDSVRSRKEWPEKTIALLRIVGEMLVNTLERKRVEDELRESETRNRLIVELLPELVLTHVDGRIQFVNSAGRAMLAASRPEDIIGREILSIVHPKDRKHAAERIGRIRAGELTVGGIEETFMGLDGRELEVEVSADKFPMGDRDAVVVIARDVTGRRKAERDVRRSISLLKATLESTADGVLVVDREGKIQTYNSRVAEIWQIEPKRLASSSETEVLEHATRLVRNPSEFAQAWRALQDDPEALTRGVIELSDGRTLEQHSKPQMLDGVPVGRVWSFSDITEQKDAERALKESVERYRLLFERNLAGVYRNTLDGRILDCNDACARILGFGSREELLEHRAEEVYFESEERDALMRELISRGSVTNEEICLMKKDGSPVWVLESATLLEGPDGQPESVEGTLIDISEIKRAEALLQESEERYRLMTQYSTDMIARLTPDWIFLFVSPAASSVLGCEPERLIGKPVEELIHPEDRAMFSRFQKALVEQEDVATIGYRLRQESNDYVWLESTCRPIFSPDSREVVEIISVSRDISERMEAQARIEYQAYHDPLTGLPNRMLFLDRLSISLAHARRTRQPLAVMFFDLDNFKFINDTLGHSVGDALLQGVARRLRRVVRTEDTVSRMGGDEFTLISEVSSTDDAARIAEKILEIIARPFEIEGHELFVTTSVGIALYPQDGEDEDTLLKSADGAMYRAKALGRNNYQLCTVVMNQRAMERLSLEKDLRGAVERQEFLLHYQPQVDLRSNRIIGVEALVRWQHPTLGLISPSRFIPVAEDTRLIFDIGEWVLREACRQVKQWGEEGLGSVKVVVNLSGRQFQHRGLVSLVREILEEVELDPQQLELEITEAMAAQNTEWSIRMTQDLRAAGVRISMDEFGTGFSSLNHLRELPVDTLKIDREFLQDIGDGSAGGVIAGAITRMAHGFGIDVIGEGVETGEQRDFLRKEECEAMQGYFFSPPLPPEALRELLAESPSDERDAEP
jgi:diguanylate cyclase (GGDEF)-like protein/PAS domain S-box-containing protein